MIPDKQRLTRSPSHSGSNHFTLKNHIQNRININDNLPRVSSKDDLCLLSKISSTSSITKLQVSLDEDSIMGNNIQDNNNNESESEIINDKQLKKKRILKELIETEKKFVQILTVLHIFFKKPLKENNILTQDEIETIFSNLDDIRILQSQFLEQLLYIIYNIPLDEDSTSSSSSKLYNFSNCTTLAHLFKTYSENANIFAIFCSSHSLLLSQKHLSLLITNNPKFSKFLEEQLTIPSVNKQTFQSLLTSIPQRICKYPLLLREYLKVLDDNNDQYESLTKSLNTLNNVLYEIDKSTKVSSDFGTLLEIQNKLILPKNFKLLEDNRIFVKQGEFIILKPNQNYGNYAFLFSDILLLTKFKKNDGKYKILRIILLNSLILCPPSESQSQNSEALFQLRFAEVSHGIFTVQFINKKELLDWEQAFKSKLNPTITFKNRSKLASKHKKNELKRTVTSLRGSDAKLILEISKRKEAENRVKELEATVKLLKKRIHKQNKLIDDLMSSDSNKKKNKRTTRLRSQTTCSSPTNEPLIDFDSFSNSSKQILRSVKEKLADYSNDSHSPRRTQSSILEVSSSSSKKSKREISPNILSLRKQVSTSEILLTSNSQTEDDNSNETNTFSSTDTININPLHLSLQDTSSEYSEEVRVRKKKVLKKTKSTSKKKTRRTISELEFQKAKKKDSVIKRVLFSPR